MADRVWLAGDPAELGPESGRARTLLLAKEYPTLLEWRRSSAGRDLVETAGRLATAAEELRRPYLDLIAGLGRELASPAWWASRIAERNTAASPLFLHVTWLRLAAGELDAPGDLAVVCDEPAVLASLADLARRRSTEVARSSKPPRRYAWPAAARRALAWSAHVAMRRLLAPPVRGGAQVLIRTFVDPLTLARPSYRDRYFPGLAPWLREQGLSVATVPLLSLGPLGYRRAWSRLRALDESFLSFDRLARPSDVAWALREAARSARMPPRVPALDGLDIGPLFEAERRRSAFDMGTLDALLSARIPKRLHAAGVNPALVIMEYENMIPEKPLLLGLRRDLPATRTVGYQHGALYPLLLCNFVTAAEAEFAPLPDRVVCNGASFRDILVAEGLPAERAVVGPALRYAHLRIPAPATATDTSPLVFVPLPLMQAQGVELLHKLVQALEGMLDARVALKPHPMASLDTLLEELNLDALPPPFEEVAGEVSEWLPRSAVTVGLASSTLYEAAAAGVPVVVVAQDAVLDLNPLGWDPDLAPTARTPGELEARVREALALGEAERADLRARGRDMIERSFSPVGDQTLRAFVEGLPPTLLSR